MNYIQTKNILIEIFSHDLAKLITSFIWKIEYIGNHRILLEKYKKSTVISNIINYIKYFTELYITDSYAILLPATTTTCNIDFYIRHIKSKYYFLREINDIFVGSVCSPLTYFMGENVHVCVKKWSDILDSTYLKNISFVFGTYFTILESTVDHSTLLLFTGPLHTHNNKSIIAVIY